MEASTPTCPATKLPMAADEAAEAHVWLIYKGQTYRVPMSFVQRHPNGAALIVPYANRDMTEPYDNAGHSKGAMRTLQKFASSALSVEEVQRIYAAQHETREQAVWNRCVRLGSLLSVAVVLGAVYVRYRQATARAVSVFTD
ncbi:hypothetical protein ABL78_5179 [Leptomonas seymouri]|uniref:Cytochrome b5 heme-binding domain-containing protein n=1 Tax=Leptomonas seymouri TaxID=5684 RepID=A0A0N1HX76_LEPSE|nr:hypothetical protein ABL78_5179 [Leptomonas seymouri]|eukprot:KPI85761.1 hypothetical protein ABL78_5179 [Leptomonas seymouri]